MESKLDISNIKAYGKMDHQQHFILITSTMISRLNSSLTVDFISQMCYSREFVLHRLKNRIKTEEICVSFMKT